MSAVVFRPRSTLRSLPTDGNLGQSFVVESRFSTESIGSVFARATEHQSLQISYVFLFLFNPDRDPLRRFQLVG